MNFNDYAHQVTLKYQVAIAIAVIKSKPNNITIEQYINRIRNKIDKMDFDSDITICSDDFKFGDETVIDDGITINVDENLNDSQTTNVSVNLLEGLNMDINIIDNTEVVTIPTNNMEVNQIIDEINNEEENTQTTFCEDVQSQKILDGDESILLSLNEHNTNKVDNEHITRNDNHYKGVGKENILNDIHNVQSLQFDSEQTELYNYNNDQINRNTNKDNTQYISLPSQVKLNNSNKLTIEDKTQMTFDSQKTELYSFQGFINAPKHDFTKKDKLKNTLISQKDNTKNNNEIKDYKTTNITDKQIIFDTQQSHTNSTQDFTENFTYISQSQSQFIEVEKNQLYKMKDYTNTKQKLLNNTEKNEINIAPINENVGINKIIQNGDSNEFCIQSNNQILDRPNDEIITFKDIEINKVNNKSDLDKINSQIQEQNDEEMYEIDITDNIDQNSQFEIVPFKVIEELNRLKIYLERKNKETDGSWSDSGYKSDSQSRSSFKSHQQTQDTLVNHSARCLLEFILNSPLILATKDIVIDMSWVLGRLIDKLYVEEKYFLFLEEVLSSIDNLLKDIYETESYDDLLKKDSNISRLFLLNRSSHIIKYTIEKITNILEKYLTQITNDLIEISNTNLTENLSYILHILECLLKRHTIIKNKNTQILNTQSTQEEKYLRKSSISDIWRKKWNPNCTTVTNDSVDVKSIEIKCMEVLNKIIVQSMDGYSLISFAALQCFNLLQS